MTFYINIAIVVTSNTIANNPRTNFHVLFIHSLYGIFKYVNPNTNTALVGAINIVTPYTPCDNKVFTISLAPLSAICGNT